MSNQDILKLDIASLSSKIKNKELSPVEITRQLLTRIEELNPLLNAFITISSNEALDSAKRAEEEIISRNWKGPLHGIPIGLKDLIYTKGIRTTMGSKLYQDFVPDFDATVVQKLKKCRRYYYRKIKYT
ncbi:amidase family protein [Aneurinibacillus tyrosinisolvens]|uniref:amidase family protein n=1 Tax=Aneurinibacillus tyrosinisolvens TaxID=1443435 RepID=UPI000A6AA146|nr:amidase family protein [Aneurinibacillus tyrosinisolvens]